MSYVGVCAIKECNTPAKHVAKTTASEEIGYAENITLDEVYDALRDGLSVPLCNNDHYQVIGRASQ